MPSPLLDVCNDVLRVPGVQLSLFPENMTSFSTESHAGDVAIRFQPQRDAYAALVENCRVTVKFSKSMAVIFTRRRKRPRPLMISANCWNPSPFLFSVSENSTRSSSLGHHLEATSVQVLLACRLRHQQPLECGTTVCKQGDRGNDFGCYPWWSNLPIIGLLYPTI